MRLILATKSPRRKAMFEMLDIAFLAEEAKTDEVIDQNLSIEDAIQKIALEKALSLKEKYPSDMIVGCDTVVVYEHQILGKPKNETDAKQMLMMLSGKTHDVLSAVGVCMNNKQETFYEKTAVTFYNLSEEQINRYIETKEPMDKAGSYGIQGKGGLFVKEIQGDYNNVVGFPLASFFQKYKV